MAMETQKPTHVVGKSEWRVDGVGLVTGTAEYTDDNNRMNGLLIAKMLTSPHAHAKILDIDTTEAEKVPGVKIVLTYKNTPRVAHTTAGQGYPEPSPYDAFMFDTKVRFVGDRVAVVAAETEHAALDALRKIKVQYEQLPPVFSPRDSMKQGVPVIHDEKDSNGIHDPSKNIAAHYDVEIGNVDKALSESEHVVGHEYELQYAQHCPIEPHVTVSYLDEKNRIVIRTATQVPFHCRRIVAQCLQIPVSQIRVIKPRIGGGFGAKQEILLEDLCAYITLKTRRPVKFEMTRKEEFISSRTRHPMIVEMKLGAKNDGTLTAIDQKVISNTGAYGTHSLTVLTNVGSKTLPFYKSPNVRFYGDAVYTNLPVSGAYRGYGGSQGAFALETLMDELAEKINVDVIDLHKKLHVKEGETNPVSAALGEGKEGHENPIYSCKLDQCIDLGAQYIKWTAKRRKSQDGPIKRGVGMACLMQGSGIPNIDMGAAHIKMNEDGSFNLSIGATDLGTGSDTVLAQIAAEALAVPMNKILVYSSDTDFTPFDVGAYASSTTYISGGAVKKAAEDCRNQILKTASEMLREDVNNLHVENSTVISTSGKSLPYENVINRSLYAKDQYQIEGRGSHISPVSPPPFATHFVEVEVDTETGKVKVIDYVAAVDCGIAINPKLAEGQVEGAVLNGISYALCEQLLFDEKGKCVNPNFFDYKIYTTLECPPIKTFLVDSFEPTGPYGAKSVAEININGPIPAIANAIYDACGIRLTQCPFTPERVLNAIKSKNAV